MRLPRERQVKKINDSAGSLEEWMGEGFEDETEVESRTVFLVGDIEEQRIKRAIKSIIALAERGAPEDPIYLYISTCGGAVEETFALYDLIKHIPNPIYTKGFGKIMSAGCLLLAAGSPGLRSMSQNSVLMYHAGWSETVGNVWEMSAYLEYFKSQERMYDILFAQECERSLEEVEALYVNKRVDNYMTAEEALEFGAIDTILGVDPGKLRAPVVEAKKKATRSRKR